MALALTPALFITHSSAPLGISAMASFLSLLEGLCALPVCLRKPGCCGSAPGGGGGRCHREEQAWNGPTSPWGRCLCTGWGGGLSGASECTHLLKLLWEKLRTRGEEQGQGTKGEPWYCHLPLQVSQPGSERPRSLTTATRRQGTTVRPLATSQVGKLRLVPQSHGGLAWLCRPFGRLPVSILALLLGSCAPI